MYVFLNFELKVGSIFQYIFFSNWKVRGGQCVRLFSCRLRNHNDVDMFTEQFSMNTSRELDGVSIALRMNSNWTTVCLMFVWWKDESMSTERNTNIYVMYQILEYMNGKMELSYKHETKYTELSMSVYWTVYKLYNKITELYSMYTIMRKRVPNCTRIWEQGYWIVCIQTNCMYSRLIKNILKWWQVW